MIDSYINSVVEFSWNSRKHMCVIADVSSNNRAVCYRVINSTDAKKWMRSASTYDEPHDQLASQDDMDRF